MSTKARLQFASGEQKKGHDIVDSAIAAWMMPPAVASGSAWTTPPSLALPRPPVILAP
jgi:hypothetical protein